MKELINIQSELKAPKSQFNSFGKYKYRNCEDVLEAVKPLLKKNKCTLIISDNIIEVGGLIFVEAIATITNEKGTDISVSAQAGINPNKKGMDIAQSFGSSSSYARKYALNGLFLIDDTKDADSEPKPVGKKTFTATDAQAEKLKGTEGKDLKDKYIITDIQIVKYNELKTK
tara:strand:+ start:142 stop:657 length:516 start_codon:yes stop_codon:yes gene_type:complete